LIFFLLSFYYFNQFQYVNELFSCWINSNRDDI
jgi:hypothetical protein